MNTVLLTNQISVRKLNKYDIKKKDSYRKLEPVDVHEGENNILNGEGLNWANDVLLLNVPSITFTELSLLIHVEKESLGGIF